MHAALLSTRPGTLRPLAALLVSVLLIELFVARAGADPSGGPIPLDQLGAHAQKQYSGKGLALTLTPDGARLRCDFQRLAGELTGTGLWLRSTATEATGTPFRVLAMGFGRDGVVSVALPATGTAQATEQLGRLFRPGLTEEYSVSVDGVRQDFLVLARPAGEGELRVDLAVDGAHAETAAAGAQLVLTDGGRKLAYSRLRVTDANGKALAARLTVTAPDRLAVLVADADATYPVRIDPTFSDANWVAINPGIPGPNATVNDVAMDGSGNLYICGAFTFVGTVPANCVAKWNGTTWSALGSGMDEGTALVSALAISGTNLYAGGRFDRAGGVTAYNIAKWDGNAWSPLGSGVSQNVYVLAASGTDLYVGGLFTSAGGQTVNHVAKWNGSAWSALGSGTDDNVYALTVNGTDLYAGGTFEFAGGMRVNRIAKWDGSAWSAVGLGFNSSVFALKMHGANLYAGGTFWNATNAGPVTVSANNIAKWNGSAWSPVGSGMSGSVYSFTTNGPDLYVTGTFTNAGGIVANRVAKWDGTTWSAVGTGMNGVVNSLVVISGTNIFAGGVFTNAGGTIAFNVAKWNGSTWSALGPGMENTVNTLAVSGSDLYVGGLFTMISGLTVNRIAKWNGATWSALGSGVDNEVLTMTASGTNLYVGGYFTNAGGITVNGIAKWNGSAWSALGAGMANTPSPSAVTALAVVGSDLYAGGSFHTAGGGAALRIAKWNGSTWSAVGGGFNGVPSSMAVIGTDLYVGGGFTQTLGAGALTVSRIAKWNGSAWSALGTGTSTGVNALAVIGTDLYAGGSFLTAGGVTVNRVAKWNGSTWSALGLGVNQTVYALTADGANLYAGGAFTTASNAGPTAVTVNRITKWDGAAWSALGSGVDSNVSPQLPGNVNALAMMPNQTLVLGGSFFFAGTTASPYLATADLDGINPTITSVTGPAGGIYRAGQALNFTVNFSAPVTVTGTPQLPLTLEFTPLNATYVSGSGSSALLFTYVVQLGNTDTDGILGSSPLVLNGGTIRAVDTSDATLTFTPPNLIAVRVDTGPPTLSVSAPSTGSTTFGPVTYTLTYADPNFSASTLTAGNITLHKTGTADGSVAVTGSGLTRTVTISGITGAGTLGISVVAGTATDTAGNAAGATALSTTFTVVPPTPPAITQEPTNVVVVAGGGATFAVAATGTAPLSYQWFFNSTTPLGGATSASLTLSNAQPAQAGDYSVVVTNIAGSVTSVVASLTVLVPPSLTASPTNQIVIVGADLTLSAAATGTPPLFYQWLKDGVPVPDATNTTLTFNPVDLTNGGRYSVVVTNAAGSTTSLPATNVVGHAAIAPPVRQPAQTLQTTGFQLSLSGEMGRSFRVQVTYDLLTWQDVTNFTSTATAFEFVDTRATNQTRGFYRVISP